LVLDNPAPEERRLLGTFRYCRNVAVLHSDPSLMPRRRAVWSSWNHIGQNSNHGGNDDADNCPTVTYWMNSLQNIPRDNPLFVTLNPPREPRNALYSEIYDHPLFDSAAITAQRELWSLQGRRNTWFAGAYFGSGFHEDGLQAGLAVVEALVAIRTADRDGLVLAAALTGDRLALTDAALLRMLASYPLLTLKVIGAIHWHALKMVLKGFRLRPRPRSPTAPVTVIHGQG
jgi:predicted NAD/FAD-binding protein